MKIKQKIKKTIKYGLFISAIAATCAGVYINAIYYERHRRKKQRAGDSFL